MRPRAPFERLVLAKPGQPSCPAAQPVAEAAGGSGCVCRITDSLLDSRRDLTTLNAYCFSEGYVDCPVWRADREAYWRDRLNRPLLNRHGDLSAGHPEDRERDRALALAQDAQERERWESEHENG